MFLSLISETISLDCNALLAQNTMKNKFQSTLSHLLHKQQSKLGYRPKCTSSLLLVIFCSVQCGNGKRERDHPRISHMLAYHIRIKNELQLQRSLNPRQSFIPYFSCIQKAQPHHLSHMQYANPWIQIPLGPIQKGEKHRGQYTAILAACRHLKPPPHTYTTQSFT